MVLRRDGGTIGTTAEQLHCLGRGLYGHGYNRIDVNITKAEAEVETESAGVQKQPPPEGGAAGREDGISRLNAPLELEWRIRTNVQAVERNTSEKVLEG